ncbi:protein maintenance of PSII under high light 1, partial [Tanacetum coccineum]
MDLRTALFAFGALIHVASASTILHQVGKNSPQTQTLDYSGRSLSYYITNFKPSEIAQISVPTETVLYIQTESSTPQLDYVAPETDICTARELYPANGYRSLRNQDLCANGEIYPASGLKKPEHQLPLNSQSVLQRKKFPPISSCLHFRDGLPESVSHLPILTDSIIQILVLSSLAEDRLRL